MIKSDGTYKDLSKYVSDSPLAPANAKPYSSDADKAIVFKELLRENGVDETWTFAKVMKTFIADPRYWAIPQSTLRKQKFDEFLLESKREREEQKRAERKENMERMASALKNHSDIVYYTKWRSVKIDEPVFQAADAKDRKAAFTNYVKELRVKHFDEIESKRVEAMKRLEERFKELEVSLNSRWLDTYAAVKSELQNPEFEKLDKLDVLTVYSVYIKDAERQSNEERQKIKRVQRRKERKIRQSFSQLVEDLRKEGKIKAGTKWTSVLPIFQDDQRYLDICGQPGSSPLELFWDITEEEERKLKLQRELALDVVNAKRYTVDSETSFDEFANVVWSDSRGEGISSSNLQVIFEDLKRLSSKRRDHDRHAGDRKLRRNQDLLRTVFKELEPPIKLEDKWEDVKLRVQDTEEYKALPTEESRIDVFERHMRRLKERGRDREHDREREREQRNRERSDRWDRDRDRRSSSRDRRRPRRNSRSAQPPLPPYLSSGPPPSDYYHDPPYYEDPQRPYLEY